MLQKEPFSEWKAWDRALDALQQGGLAVLPTDTIYGIVAKALDKRAVKRLYALRRTSSKKPFIILISSLRDLAAFGLEPSATELHFLSRVWPGKMSVVLRASGKRFGYLHRGTNTLAFRLPKKKSLQALLRKTGPLAAPSANPEGEKPAETVAEAKAYFGNQVDAYVAAGRGTNIPSTLVSLIGGKPVVIRRGSVRIRF